MSLASLFRKRPPCSVEQERDDVSACACLGTLRRGSRVCARIVGPAAYRKCSARSASIRGKMRRMPFARREPDWPDAPRRLWPKIGNRTRVQLYASLARSPGGLGCQYARSLAAESCSHGPRNGHGYPGPFGARPGRRDCLFEAGVTARFAERMKVLGPSPTEVTSTARRF